MNPPTLYFGSVWALVPEMAAPAVIQSFPSRWSQKFFKIMETITLTPTIVFSTHYLQCMAIKEAEKLPIFAGRKLCAKMETSYNDEPTGCIEVSICDDEGNE